ncbi:hypothetical protein [Bradyrhizobium sp. USDA 10063]
MPNITGDPEIGVRFDAGTRLIIQEFEIIFDLRRGALTLAPPGIAFETSKMASQFER